MSRVFYTSDTHLDHTFVAKLRGFTYEKKGPDGETVIVGDKAAHDRAIIANWNSVVRPDDTVWLLGDVGMGHLERWEHQFRQLNGLIHLITGNHDDVSPVHRDSWKYQGQWMYQGRFASVQAYARRKVGSYMFLLSHFPYDGDHTGTDRYTQYRLRDEGMWLVHGHTHLPERISGAMRMEPGTMSSPAKWMGRQLHVGLDAWGLHPVSQEDVIAEMAKAELT